MAESKIANHALNIDVENMRETVKTPGVGGEEDTNMVALPFCVAAEVQQNSTPPTEHVCKVGIIEYHDDPMTQSENLETEYLSAAEIQSTTLNSATESQTDFKIQHILMLESDREDGSAKVGESVWKEVPLDNDDGIQLESPIQVDYSDLAISEAPNHFASFRMIFPYFIRILHAFNSLMINSTPAKKLTGEDSHGASTSDINGHCSLDVGHDYVSQPAMMFPTEFPTSDDVFQACCSSGEDKLKTPGHGSENQCPYAFPDPERYNPGPTHDRTIDLLALIVAGEILVIILCMIAFFYHTLEMNDY